MPKRRDLVSLACNIWPSPVKGSVQSPPLITIAKLVKFVVFRHQRRQYILQHMYHGMGPLLQLNLAVIGEGTGCRSPPQTPKFGTNRGYGPLFGSFFRPAWTTVYTVLYTDHGKIWHSTVYNTLWVHSIVPILAQIVK